MTYALTSCHSSSVTTELCKTACGHELVRRAFCKVVHFGALDADQRISFLNGTSTDPRQAGFRKCLDAAIKLFECNSDDLQAKLLADVPNCCKSVTRINVFEALSLEPNQAGTLFGLFPDVVGWKTTFKQEVGNLLIAPNSKSQLVATASNLDEKGSCLNQSTIPPPTSWGRSIEIYGDRNDSDYLVENGGSWTQLVSNLKLRVIASQLFLRGPAGEVDLRTRAINSNFKSDHVTLRIIVRHSPASEYE